MIMKIFLSAVLSFFFLNCKVLYGQSLLIDKAQFFNDTSVLNATITTNMGKLLREKKAGYQMQATFTSILTDGTAVNDSVLLEIRGHFRKDYCYLPPLKVDFKYQKSSILHKLGSLKLVSECNVSNIFDQYLLKEFLVYKMYNLITDMSFRVRLLNLNLAESGGKRKPINEHAFLLEDIKEVARRNSCIDWEKANLFEEDTQRDQMTLVAIFEYMIGNTDWGVPANHNTRLIVPEADSLGRPFVIPYDFDYSGLVSTGYGVPDEKLSIESVQQRLYRGFPRTMEELNKALDIFKQQKEKIYGLIKNFELLTPRSKKEMIGYLDSFFEQINKPDQVKYFFIKNARKQL